MRARAQQSISRYSKEAFRETVMKIFSSFIDNKQKGK
jgi:hypothetical protein